MRPEKKTSTKKWRMKEVFIKNCCFLETSRIAELVSRCLVEGVFKVVLEIHGNPAPKMDNAG